MKSLLLQPSSAYIALLLSIISYLPNTIMAATTATAPPEKQNQTKKEHDDNNMEALLSVARKRHPTITIISSNWENEGENLRVLYAIPKDSQLHIMTIDRLSAKITQDKPYKLPDKVNAMDVEKMLAILKTRFNIKRVNKTLLERKDNQLIRTVFFTDNLRQRRMVRVDAKTGDTIEHYVLKSR